MTLQSSSKKVNYKHVFNCLLLLLLCLQYGSMAASARHHHRQKKMDPKHEKAVLEALGMKRKPDNEDR